MIIKTTIEKQGLIYFHFFFWLIPPITPSKGTVKEKKKWNQDKDKVGEDISQIIKKSPKPTKVIIYPTFHLFVLFLCSSSLLREKEKNRQRNTMK